MSEAFDTARLHPHEATVLVRAAECLGVDLTQHDVDYLRATAKFAAVVDDMVDNEGLQPKITTLLDDPVESLAGRLGSADRELIAGVTGAMSDYHRQAWLEADKLPVFAAKKKAACTPGDLSNALSSEAHLFMRVFSLDVVPARDAESRQLYNRWLWHFSRGGYHVDQVVDMSTDFREGRIGVAPTLRSRRYLSKVALGELHASLSLAHSPGLLWELGKTAAATIREGARADQAASA